MLVEKTLPENLRKKQTRDTARAAALQKARVARKTEMVAKKADWLQRGQTHFEAHQTEQRRVIDARRTAQSNGQLFVPAENKIVLVVRIKGINGVDPKTKLILRLLRLRQIHNAAFVRVNKATLNMLQRVQPFVTYGYPNRKTVEMLLYKRGYGKINGQRVRLSNNFIVEENLKKENCVCIEDVVQSVMDCGVNFKKVNNFPLT